MATQVPPKKNQAFTMYVSLASQSSTHTMQSNPTLAAGDVKVATDDGAPANITTLPTVDADFTKRVKVELSASEMNGDNVTIVFSDAAGSEWDDLVINLQTTARQIDDLAFPTVSGRSLDVTATGAAGIDWGNVENPTTALNLSATNIDVDQVVASVSGAVGSIATGGIAAASFAAGAIDNAAIATDAIGSAELAASAITEIQSGLSTLTPAQVNAEVVDALNVDTYAEPGQGAPPATTTIERKLAYLYKAWRNKKTETSSQYSLYADDASTVDQKATVSDDGTTTTVGEIATGP